MSSTERAVPGHTQAKELRSVRGKSGAGARALHRASLGKKEERCRGEPQNADADAETLTQRFYFLKSLLDGRDFNDALLRILRSPHVRSAGLVVEKELRRGGFRLGPSEMRQVVSRTPRQPLPENHPLRGRSPALASVPERLTTTEHRDVTDTAENRFVRYALEVFAWTLSGMAERLEELSGPTTAGACLCREMRRLEARLPVEPERWRGLIAARAPQGAPFAATWGELWAGVARTA